MSGLERERGRGEGEGESESGSTSRHDKIQSEESVLYIR